MSLGPFILLSRFVNIIHKSLCHRPCSVIALTHRHRDFFFHKEILFFFCLFSFEALWVYGWKEMQRRASGRGRRSFCLDETQDGDILLCRLSLWVTLEA